MKKLIVLFLFLWLCLHSNAQKNIVVADSLKLQLLSFKDLDKQQNTKLPKHLYQIASKNQNSKAANTFKSINYKYLKYQNILEAYAERYYLLENLYPYSNYYIREKPGSFKLIGIPATPPIRKNY